MLPGRQHCRPSRPIPTSRLTLRGTLCGSAVWFLKCDGTGRRRLFKTPHELALRGLEEEHGEHAGPMKIDRQIQRPRTESYTWSDPWVRWIKTKAGNGEMC